MPSWNEVLNEIQVEYKNNPVDRIRRKYLKKLYTKLNRNVITYYSGWLQKSADNIHHRLIMINDDDMNGFMATIHKLDRDKGLDLILHTPGGEIAATEAIVEYLRKMFKDIRIIVPHLAMSAGTMIACAGKEIIMGKHSNLGPIDPQFNGISAEGVLEEFKKAKEEIQAQPHTIPLWQMIINKYHPTFIGDCEKAIKWSREIVTDWLKTGMFKDSNDKEKKTKEIVKILSSHEETSSHSRHLSVSKCEDIGLKIVSLESLGEQLQDIIMTVHHAYMHTFSITQAVKIIENHLGIAIVTASMRQNTN